jgi:hypothetical protein
VDKLKIQFLQKIMESKPQTTMGFRSMSIGPFRVLKWPEVPGELGRGKLNAMTLRKTTDTGQRNIKLLLKKPFSKLNGSFH